MSTDTDTTDRPPARTLRCVALTHELTRVAVAIIIGWACILGMLVVTTVQTVRSWVRGRRDTE